MRWPKLTARRGAFGPVGLERLPADAPQVTMLQVMQVMQADAPQVTMLHGMQAAPTADVGSNVSDDALLDGDAVHCSLPLAARAASVQLAQRAPPSRPGPSFCHQRIAETFYLTINER